MNYVMNESEYNVIEKLLTKTGLNDTLIIQQTQNPRNDYFLDLENNEEISLNKGIKIIQDSMGEIDNYNLTSAEKSTFQKLCENIC